MANLLKRHEFWLGMFITALCLLLGWRSEDFSLSAIFTTSLITMRC